jgi:cob(I)alamin adenosyltransferase
VANMTGRVHIYTGDGKGKTTAALGLTVRATGAGLRVFIGQFIKGREYSEIKTIKEQLPTVTVEQFGLGCFIKRDPTPEDIEAAEKGLTRIREAMLSGEFGVIIADEANCAVTAGLFDADALLQLVQDKPENIELVFTGRNADPLLIECADLVTEMKKIKHYYDDGVQGRPGIES